MALVALGELSPLYRVLGDRYADGDHILVGIEAVSRVFEHRLGGASRERVAVLCGPAPGLQEDNAGRPPWPAPGS